MFAPNPNLYPPRPHALYPQYIFKRKMTNFKCSPRAALPASNHARYVAGNPLAHAGVHPGRLACPMPHLHVRRVDEFGITQAAWAYFRLASITHSSRRFYRMMVSRAENPLSVMDS